MRLKPLQDEAEITAFCDLLAREGVRSYLEIGSKYGGSLKRVANALPKGSLVVSIDKNTNGPHLQSTVDELRASGYDARLIPMFSTSEKAINAAIALAPFDALFIDADHRSPGVWHDWNHYGPLARIVAFHDIGWKRAPDWEGNRIDVPAIWDEIKQPYRYEEIKFDKTGNNNGIGVLWR